MSQGFGSEQLDEQSCCLLRWGSLEEEHIWKWGSQNSSLELSLSDVQQRGLIVHWMHEGRRMELEVYILECKARKRIEAADEIMSPRKREYRWNGK